LLAPLFFLKLGEQMRLIKLTDIWEESSRHRRDFGDLEALSESILTFGLLQPIVLTPEASEDKVPFKLIAGGRRLAAFKLLKREEIPAMLLDELPKIDQKKIELHENIKRKNLTWQEEVRAIYQYHKLRAYEEGKSLSMAEIGKELQVSETQVQRSLVVAPYIYRSSPKFNEAYAEAATVTGVYAAIQRSLDREKQAKTSEVLEQATKIFAKEEQPPEETASEPLPFETVKEPKTLHNADFVEWAAKYKGPAFSFVHCDFPYGINYKGSRNASVAGSGHVLYPDDPDLYWALVEALLSNATRLVAPLAHVLFWLDMRYYTRTIETFEKRGFTLVTPNPIIWAKSDKRGKASDPERRPRHTYEVALLFSRGDRKTLKLIEDVCYAPAEIGQRTHISEKPEPVLRHFLRAFVDDTTTVLDPTFGSGTAIIIAEELKAKLVVGVEQDEEIYKTGVARVKKSRSLRYLSSKVMPNDK
jgi:ParB family chromosome partitioning protein